MTEKLLAARNAWVLLLLISAVSFLAAELVGERSVAIAAIMVIAAVKIAVILVRFMDVSTAPVAIRRYLYVWTGAVAAAVIALWQVSATAG